MNRERERELRLDLGPRWLPGAVLCLIPASIWVAAGISSILLHFGI